MGLTTGFAIIHLLRISFLCVKRKLLFSYSHQKRTHEKEGNGETTFGSFSFTKLTAACSASPDHQITIMEET